jgi:hypothetical protein
MRARFWIQPALAVLLAAGMSGGLAGATAAEAATTCQVWGAQPANVSADTELHAVAVISSCYAWAAGSFFNGSIFQTLIERWNGTAWRVQASPNAVGISDTLNAITAPSSSRAWAVGSNDTASATRTLIEQWNGTAWKVQASPNVGTGNNFLSAVTATSGTNAWAVGHYHSGAHDHTLIERWNGFSWKPVSSPNPGGSTSDNILYGVTATSATSAWAVGYNIIGPTARTLIEHWNGAAWKVVTSPNVGTVGSYLHGVAATSATNAWAVGWYLNGTGSRRTLAEHWNGKAWKAVPSPSGGAGDNFLYSVDVTSAVNAWTVGNYQTATGAQRTLLERWNGTAWKGVASPSPGGSVGNINILSGVAGTDCGDTWAVGDYSDATGTHALALHC